MQVHATANAALLEIDPTILALIPHIKLSDDSSLRQNKAIAYGAFGDVFRCRAIINEEEEAEVAAKRLRFHLNPVAIKKVSKILYEVRS